MEFKTYEVFTTEFSKTVQAPTPSGAHTRFWADQPLDEDVDIIAIIEVERGQEFINGKCNCAISDVSISLPSDEEIREPIQNALYSTDRLTTDQCTELADGILTYLNDAGYKVVKQ